MDVLAYRHIYETGLFKPPSHPPLGCDRRDDTGRSFWFVRPFSLSFFQKVSSSNLYWISGHAASIVANADQVDFFGVLINYIYIYIYIYI